MRATAATVAPVAPTEPVAPVASAAPVGRRRAALGHSASRTLAAVLGTLPVALAIGIAIAYLIPLPVTERYLIGSVAVFPLWTAASLVTFLAPSGRRAWLRLAIVLALAVVVILAARAFLPDPFVAGRA
jgi:hypothetical protein